MERLKIMRTAREQFVERHIIDQETRGTKDYRRFSAALLKGGLINAGERVIALEYRPGTGDLTIIVGSQK